MYVKFRRNCQAFTANDGCEVQELLHPEKDAINLPYSVAWCRVAVGSRTYKHLLRQTETYLIVSGNGQAYIGTNVVDVEAGDAVVIPADTSQWIANTGSEELVFAALVNPCWRAEDDVRLDEEPYAAGL